MIDKILWIAVTAFISGSIGLIFWKYQRHKERQENKECLKVMYSVGWTNNKNEFAISIKVINTSVIPVILSEILYTIRRSGRYARTVKDPSFKDPFETFDFFKHNPFQYMRHKFLKCTGFNDHRGQIYRTFTKDERPKLNKYGDECLGRIVDWDHTINNSSKIKISLSVVTSTGAKFKGSRVDYV
jgi:hypothetical protein